MTCELRRRFEKSVNVERNDYAHDRRDEHNMGLTFSAIQKACSRYIYGDTVPCFLWRYF